MMETAPVTSLGKSGGTREAERRGRRSATYRRCRDTPWAPGPIGGVAHPAPGVMLPDAYADAPSVHLERVPWILRV